MKGAKMQEAGPVAEGVHRSVSPQSQNAFGQQMHATMHDVGDAYRHLTAGIRFALMEREHATERGVNQQQVAAGRAMRCAKRELPVVDVAVE